jgi:hypothetical protein
MDTGITTIAVAGCDRVASADKQTKNKRKTIPNPLPKPKRQRVFLCR